MTYEATVEFKFDATFTPTYGSSSWTSDDFIPEEHYLITAPAADLNCKQYFKLFEKFLLCVGMEASLYAAWCRFAGSGIGWWADAWAGTSFNRCDAGSWGGKRLCYSAS